MIGTASYPYTLTYMVRLGNIGQRTTRQVYPDVEVHFEHPPARVALTYDIIVTSDLRTGVNLHTGFMKAVFPDPFMRWYY